MYTSQSKPRRMYGSSCWPVSCTSPCCMHKRGRARRSIVPTHPFLPDAVADRELLLMPFSAPPAWRYIIDHGNAQTAMAAVRDQAQRDASRKSVCKQPWGRIRPDWRRRPTQARSSHALSLKLSPMPSLHAPVSHQWVRAKHTSSSRRFARTSCKV
jgi:hypothetical protein